MSLQYASLIRFLNGTIQRIRLRFFSVAVIAVVDRNEAHAHEREDFLQVSAGINIVSGKTGEILADDTVDLFLPDILHHLLEAGAIEVYARIAVIDVFPGDDHIRAIPQELTDNIPLATDGVTFRFVAVIAG